MKDVRVTYEVDGKFVEPFMTIKDTVGGDEDGYWGVQGDTSWFGVHCDEKDIPEKLKATIKEMISDYQEEIERCKDIIYKLSGFTNSLEVN